MTEEADFPEPVEVIDPSRKKENAERVARILWLGQALASGDPAGKATVERMPDSGALIWHDRKAGDPWPADAPWSVNDAWAKGALHREERTGDTLGLCCDRTMIRWLAGGDARPLAAWMAAGLTPGRWALRILAGALCKDLSIDPIDHWGSDFEKFTIDVVRGSRGRRRMLSKALEDIRIKEEVSSLMKAGEKYECACEDVAARREISLDAVRNSYDRLKGRK